MTMRALVSADRPVVRIWHPDDPKVYVEIRFESQEAANNAVEQLNGMLKYATGFEFGEDAAELRGRVVPPIGFASTPWPWACGCRRCLLLGRYGIS